MRTILHVLTQPEDSLQRIVAEQQRALPESTVEVVDLSQGDPDYNSLIEKVFAADSVEVW